MATLRNPINRGYGSEYKISFKVSGELGIFNVGLASKKKAEHIYRMVEQLESIRSYGGTIPPDLDQQIASLDPKYIKRLEKYRLIDQVKKQLNLTFADLIDAYIAYSLNTVLPETARKYEGDLLRIDEYLRGLNEGRSVLLDDLNQGDLRDFHAHKISEGKKASTVSGYLKRGAEAFNYAVDKGWVDNNPFHKLKERGRRNDRKSEADAKLQEELMTDEALDTLLSCQKSKRSKLEDVEWNALIHILRWTGCRISEAQILRWQDIDFDNQKIHFRGKRDGDPQDKSFKKRQSPLPEPLVPVLEELRECAADGSAYLLNKIGKLAQKPERSICEGTKVKKQGRWGYSGLGTTFKRILGRNSIPVWPKPFHAFRAYRVNELLKMGARPIDLEAWLGHSQAVMQAHYAHSSEDDLRRVSNMEWPIHREKRTGGHPGEFESALF